MYGRSFVIVCVCVYFALSWDPLSTRGSWETLCGQFLGVYLVGMDNKHIRVSWIGRDDECFLMLWIGPI